MEERKVALVTGASRGIGRGIAVKLGSLGYDVAVNYNSNEEEANKVVEQIKGFGSNAVAVKANVGDRGEVNAMFRTVVKELGKIDVLVNNAGVVDDAFLLFLLRAGCDAENVQGQERRHRQRVVGQLQDGSARSVRLFGDQGRRQFDDRHARDRARALRY